jgi:hypothetical protein
MTTPGPRRLAATVAGLPLLLLLLVAPADPAERRFSVGQEPSWIVDPGGGAATSPATADSSGTRYLLFDQQVRVADDTSETYVRTVWKAETTAGVQDASEIEISFDPSFERLVIHHARIARGGSTVWSFAPRDVRVMETEEDLDARLYNGELTATIFLRDLRIGDTVDYAYTLAGVNPVLGGRFDRVLWTGASVPVDRLHRRLLWQKEAEPHIRLRGGAAKPEVSPVAGGTSYRWLVRDWKPPAREERTPSWYQPYPRVEISEFGDWAAVAARETELFASLDAPAPAVDALVRTLRLEGASEDARVDRAVRFVQDEVRYLGLEMGPSSHQPHPPAQTLARRFGDCKDKASLLVAILRRVGVPAWPALVSTRARATLDERLPSLFAFDHVIVALRLGDGLHWIDATAAEQGGPVRTRTPPPFARALLVDSATRGLTPIPQPVISSPSTEVEETFAAASWSGPVRLDVVTTYRGDDADDARRDQGRATRAETSKRYRDFYAREHGELRVVELPRVEDDRDRNVVVVRESYEIPHLWSDGAHDFRAWLVDDWLRKPQVLERAAPFSLPHPAYLKHTLTLRLPGPPDLDPLKETVTGPSFAMDAAWTVSGPEARLVYTYRSLRASVPPKELATYSATVDRAADLVVCRLPARPRPAATTPKAAAASPSAATRRKANDDEAVGTTAVAGLLFGLAGVSCWGGVVLVSSWRRGRRRAAFHRRQVAWPGQQPSTAVRLDDVSQLAVAGTGGQCQCRASWREVDRATVSFDGGPMAVVTRRCDGCGRVTTTYFRLRGRAS